MADMTAEERAKIIWASMENRVAVTIEQIRQAEQAATLAERDRIKRECALRTCPLREPEEKSDE